VEADSPTVQGLVQTPPNGMPEKLSPQAASRLVTPEFITSPIDGKRLKSLRRHVSLYFASEGDFKRAYGLKADFPMTAPAYSAQRSAVAKSLGLGRKPGATAPKPAAKKAPARKKATPPAE
jgi:predicted transcriptional regulator